MGHSRVTKYKVSIAYNDGSTAFVGTDDPRVLDLETYLREEYASMKPGGANAHISRVRGYIPAPRRAEVFNQQSGESVAKFEAPVFMVWDEVPLGRKLE